MEDKTEETSASFIFFFKFKNDSHQAMGLFEIIFVAWYVSLDAAICQRIIHGCAYYLS